MVIGALFDPSVFEPSVAVVGFAAGLAGVFVFAGAEDRFCADFAAGTAVAFVCERAGPPDIATTATITRKIPTRQIESGFTRCSPCAFTTGVF
jgi:hypothetical protein